MQYVIDNLPAEIDWETGSTGPQRTLQNAKNLLMCRTGEVPYDRSRGYDDAINDLPLEQMKEELMPMLDRLMMYEPDAEVVDAEVLTTANGTHIKVTLEISD